MNGDEMYDWWVTANNDEIALLLAYLGDGNHFSTLLTDDSREGLLRTAQALRDEARELVSKWKQTGAPVTHSGVPLYRQLRAAMASLTQERTAQDIERQLAAGIKSAREAAADDSREFDEQFEGGRR